MRKLNLVFAIILVLSSCSNKKNNFNEDLKSIETLNPDWMKFYKTKISDFNLEKFELSQTSEENELIQGNILADFDTNFNKNHSQLLINSPDSSEYIDLDYYILQISKNENGQLICNGYGVDQEINWVNRKTKEIKRIGFNGPSSRTEDAKWINKSKIVLFGTFDKTITLEFINLKTLESKFFIYSDSINKEYNFTELVRLKNIKFK